MPGYVAKALERFKVIKAHELTIYALHTNKVQARATAHETDSSPPGTAADTLFSSNSRVFLYPSTLCGWPGHYLSQ
jgi:hypothetical protein